MGNENTAPVASDPKGMKPAELQAFISSRGPKGTSRMRKSQLIEFLSSPEAPAPCTCRAAPSSKTGKPVEELVKDSEEPSEKITAASAQASTEATQTSRKPYRRVAVSEPAGLTSTKPVIDIELPTPLAVQAPPEKNEAPVTTLDSIELPKGEDVEERGRNRRDRNNRRRGRDRNRNDHNERNDRNNRYNRNRGECQDRGEVVREDDQLAPIAGIPDTKNNHAFIRISGYLSGPNDVFMTLGDVRRWGLRAGDAVTGAARQPREGERQRQKYNALVRVDPVNGITIEEAQARRESGKLTPVYPSEQLHMETSAKAFTPRVIDLVTPIGKDQHGLIVPPPKADKTMVIQQIAKVTESNNPEVHLTVALVDECPEEVTDMCSIIEGEVIASTFDHPASDHTPVAELAIERTERFVELGQDVVVLLDLLTRLSRVYNLAAPTPGRILPGGVDASALYPPKKLFDATRNLKEGGSLTTVVSVLVETGSKMDEAIFEEFKDTGSMELRLSRQLTDRRIFPAIDVNTPGTRREEMLFAPEELHIMQKLRRVLGILDQQSGLEFIPEKPKETQSNAEFLTFVQKTTPSVD